MYSLYEIRDMRPDETPVLSELLYQAIFQPPGQAPLPRDILGRPEFALYVEDFGRPGDVCLVAVRGRTLLGGVWTRLMAQNAPGFGTLDASTPELVIALFPEYRGRGIGTRLMRRMLETLRSTGCARVSLSADRRNHALRLYARLGFRVLEERDTDCLMVLDLDEEVGRVPVLARC